MVNKYQQGGAAGQNIQEQVVALVQAAMQGNEQAQAQVQQIIEAAKQGDQQAIQLANMIQEVVNAMKGQARSQQIGGKLAYLHKLRTGVNPNEEVVYEKCGGTIKKKVVKKDNGGKAQQAYGGAKVKSKVYFNQWGGRFVPKIVEQTLDRLGDYGRNTAREMQRNPWYQRPGIAWNSLKNLAEYTWTRKSGLEGNGDENTPDALYRFAPPGSYLGSDGNLYYPNGQQVTDFEDFRRKYVYPELGYPANTNR